MTYAGADPRSSPHFHIVASELAEDKGFRWKCRGLFTGIQHIWNNGFGSQKREFLRRYAEREKAGAKVA
jgi:hypothetical protein